MISTRLEGRIILVVEDDYLVGEMLADLLVSAGAIVIGPIGWLEEAMGMAEDDGCVFDTAILDINLHGSLSYPLVDLLTARQIAVIFATGYGAGSIDTSYQHHPRCTKPFTWVSLLAALDNAAI
ncbi:MAG TPA: response regulator [Luteibacter sp.]|jgi:DNA-binding response OmpR family regulator|nr:response regulator [Luteibacter sp.]